MKTARLLISLVLLAGCAEQTDERHAAVGREIVPVDVSLIDGRPPAEALAPEQVLHRGNGQEPQTLDPHQAEGVPSSNILRDLFEGLTAETTSGRIIPGAAQRWNISRDGLVYTFHLRRDGRWSNGDPVTAKDFVYSFQRVASPETASSYIHMLAPIKNAGAVVTGELPPQQLGVEALDEFTVQISLDSPTPYFLGLLNHSVTYPVHQASVETHGSEFSRPGKLVSNGAYQLSKWVVRSNIELVKNPYYWDTDNTIIRQVNYYPIEDQSTELQRYRSGELDWTDEVPSNLFEWLQKNLPSDLVVTPWLGSYYLGINLTREPFLEGLELRQALALAIDRDILTEKVTRFGEIPAYAFLPEGIPDYTPQAPEWAAWSQSDREQEAVRLYSIAGYGPDNPLQIELRYNSGENNKKVALAVASMWKQILGVETTLINEEWKVFLQNRKQKAVTQVFRAGWISDYNDPFSFLELLHSENGRNDYGYTNSSYDVLLNDVAGERVPVRRRRLMEAAERMMLADQPVIPLYTYVTKRLVRPTLKGWENNIMDHHYSKHMYRVKELSKDAASTESQEPPVESEPPTEPSAGDS